MYHSAGLQGFNMTSPDVKIDIVIAIVIVFLNADKHTGKYNIEKGDQWLWSTLYNAYLNT